MFVKNENDTINERVLFKDRPNFFFSCKNIFLLAMLLGFISYLAPIIFSFVFEVQVYLVRIIDLPLLTYTSWIFIIFFIVIVLWIFWIFLNWRFTEYIITNLRIILKKGVLIKESHHMPFHHIQDITVSQGIFRKIISIGDVTVVNAYDLNNIEFINVRYPEDIQELIFIEMNKDYEKYYNIVKNNFRDYDDSHLRQNSHYQRPNRFNNYKYDDLNFNDFNKQINHNNEYNYNEYYNENLANQKNPNLINNDFLNPIDETMQNFDKKQYINEKSGNNSYYHSIDYPYKNHNEKFHLRNKHEYKENRKITKNQDDKTHSVMDIYSKKFKKHKK